MTGVLTDLPEACERLNTVIAEGRLTRDEWSGTDEQGRETLCLLAAMSPEVAKREDAKACPAGVLPEWLAYLSVWIDDAPSNDWLGRIRRFAGVLPRLASLSAERLQRLDYECCAIAVREARAACDPSRDVASLAAVDRVLALLDRAIAGDAPMAGEWAEAEAAARVAWATTRATTGAARRAALAAAEAAADAAASAADAAAWAAREAGGAREAVSERASACDRMCHAMFDAMEAA